MPTEKLMADREVFIKKAQKVETEIFDVLDQREKRKLWRLEREILKRSEDMGHGKIK